MSRRNADHPQRAQFTLRELIAVMVICALALGILFASAWRYRAPIDSKTTVSTG